VKRAALPLLFALALAMGGCATSTPMSSCDMAAALYRSPHLSTHRLGASWFEQGACCK